MPNYTKKEIEQFLKQSEIIETLERKVKGLESWIETHDYVHYNLEEY